MSLSSPYGQSAGAQSPLGGTGVASPLGWANWQGGAMAGGGSSSPAPQSQLPPATATPPATDQAAPQAILNGIPSGVAVAPPDATAPPQTTLNNIQQSGSAMAPPAITSGAINMMQPVTGPVNTMVKALAQPAPTVPQGIGGGPR